MNIAFGVCGAIRKVIFVGGQEKINCSRSFYSCTNFPGEFNVSSFSLMPNNSSDWVTAGLENLPDHDIKVEPGMDPRQAYCTYIFYPGRFQRDVIDKALIVCIVPL